MSHGRLISQICQISLIGLIAACMAAPVRAQSVSLSVSPPVVEILLSPNKKVTQTFTLQTQGGDLTVTPELHLATPTDSEGHVTIDPRPLEPSTLPLTVTLTGPSTTPTLTFEAATTDVPQDVYLALVFRAHPLTPYSIPNTSYSIPAISSLILVTITPTGTLPISLDLQNFTPPVLHDSWSVLTITPTIQNHTGTMIRPLGTYSIISPSGKTVFTLPLYPNLILGSSSRIIMGSPDNPRGYQDNPSQTPGVISNPAPLSWSPKWSDLGPYRLRLTVTSQGGTKLTEVEKVVWLLPLRLIIITLTLIIILVKSAYAYHSKK